VHIHIGSIQRCSEFFDDLKGLRPPMAACPALVEAAHRKVVDGV